jgi:D-alanyl-D-alanine carboxypeptidase/D-alanyl-D-alanine-endopeptidase (penicillin-binding protein 4)
MCVVRPVLAAVLAALLLAAPAHALDAQQVRDRLAAQARAAGPGTGLYARDLETGRTLIAVREDLPRIPASVEKLFVTASALLRFGPDGQLQTRVVTEAPVDAEGVVAGDVWLVGGGDPTLTEAGLKSLVSAVRAAGVREIKGGVRADDTQFDRRRGTPRTGFRPDRDLGGRLGALILRRGFQPDPAAYVATRFSRLLQAADVEVGRRARLGGSPGDTAVELATLPSPTMAALARATNVPSDNFLAEMLLKALGASFGGGGSTFSGARVAQSTLDDFGVRPRIVDGSGLSRANRTTPRQVVRLLERMNTQEIARTWESSLALTGRTGTVRRRMRGTPAAGKCRVKTGTIIGVSNLAGVCATPGGPVAFAWLMNGVNVFGARRIQDRLTATLARYEG